jgi:hypothetical protein
MRLLRRPQPAALPEHPVFDVLEKLAFQKEVSQLVMSLTSDEVLSMRKDMTRCHVWVGAKEMIVYALARKATHRMRQYLDWTTVRWQTDQIDPREFTLQANVSFQGPIIIGPVNKELLSFAHVWDAR